VDLDVGVVGLGRMGNALASALIAAGNDVTVWDRDAEKIATTAMLGAGTAVDARQVGAQCDVVFTALPGRDAVLEVALDEDTGLLAGLRDGGLMIEMTTADPDLAATLDEAFHAAGRRFVDAPVSGKAPRMTVLLGARPTELDDDVVALLHQVSSALVYCGGRGRGYAAKLVNQHIKYAWYLASAEALLIAKRFGLDPQRAVEAVTASSGASRGFDDAAAYFLQDSTEIKKHAAVSTIAKDMKLAAQLASTVGVYSPTLATVDEFFDHVLDSSYATQPFPESIALLESLRVVAEGASKSRKQL
jgi:3-hydroxyisobutyrate dehydrogenase-like beta-hydroxyacid dehydrogenase